MEVESRHAHLESVMRQSIGIVRPARQKLKGEARRRGNAGTETLSRRHVSKARRLSLLRKQVAAQSAEPPDTDPYVRWCGRGGIARRPPIPIVQLFADRLRLSQNGRSAPRLNVRMRRSAFWPSLENHTFFKHVARVSSTWREAARRSPPTDIHQGSRWIYQGSTTWLHHGSI